jgi:hypothetical protein
MRGLVLLIKLHHLGLAPWILFSIPSGAVLGLQVPFAAGIALLGVVGMILRNRSLVLGSSMSLLGLMVLGKVTSDLNALEPIDTGVLLLQFVGILFLMEASLPVVQYEEDFALLGERNDELSGRVATRLASWLRSQLYADARLGIVSFLTSLGLLIVGSLAGVGIGHLAVLAVFVLAAVVALLFLLTYRREPETTGRSK